MGQLSNRGELVIISVITELLQLQVNTFNIIADCLMLAGGCFASFYNFTRKYIVNNVIYYLTSYCSST